MPLRSRTRFRGGDKRVRNPWVYVWGAVGLALGYYGVKHFRMSGGRVI